MLALALLLAVAPADTIPAPPRRSGLVVTASTGLDVPLTLSDPSMFGDAGSRARGTNAALRLSGTASFRGASASVTLYRYLVPRLQAPWDPDFVYSLGYAAPWPRGLHASYANYDANRLQPVNGQPVTHVDRGVVTVAFAPAVSSPFRAIDPTAGVYPRASYEVVPSYLDMRTGDYQRAKHRVGAGVYAHALGGLFVNVALFVYPDPAQQQPWDSDYSYAFGFARGWPSSVTVQYANYTGTRYPWREAEERTGRFRNGTLQVAYSHRF